MKKILSKIKNFFKSKKEKDKLKKSQEEHEFIMRKVKNIINEGREKPKTKITNTKYIIKDYIIFPL